MLPSSLCSVQSSVLFNCSFFDFELHYLQFFEFDLQWSQHCLLVQFLVQFLDQVLFKLEETLSSDPTLQFQLDVLVLI